MAGRSLVEGDVPGEVIFPREITDTPSESVLFVPYKYCLISAWSSFSAKFWRNDRKALAPPYSVAVAVADVFSKNYHSIPNKIDKILNIFDRLDNVKSRGVIFYT